MPEKTVISFTEQKTERFAKAVHTFGIDSVSLLGGNWLDSRSQFVTFWLLIGFGVFLQACQSSRQPLKIVVFQRGKVLSLAAQHRGISVLQS